MPLRWLHGTSDHLAPEIRAEGLRAPFAGRGVHLVGLDDRWLAEDAARAACLRLRDRLGDSEGLLLTVDPLRVPGEAWEVQAGDLDRAPVIVVAEVPPSAIVFCETVPSLLPKKGSFAESFARTMSAGYGAERPGATALPSLTLARKIGRPFSPLGSPPSVLGPQETV